MKEIFCNRNFTLGSMQRMMLGKIKKVTKDDICKLKNFRRGNFSNITLTKKEAVLIKERSKNKNNSKKKRNELILMMHW